MPRSRTSPRRAATKPAGRAQAVPKSKQGVLPEWNLADLYSAIDDPAIKRDLDRVDADCVAFEEAYKGKLAEMATASMPGAGLAEAVRRYEAIDDLMGRLGSYAGLVHAGDTVDPARTKFYGDVQERLTAASTHLLFFTLELNRIDDALLEAAMADPALGHYRPWLDDVRRYKPYQLEDRVEQLFHEKSVTAYSAWNRLFDATIANLRFKVQGKSLAIEPTLNLLQDRSAEKRKAAARALAHTFKQNVQQFALVTNTLAKDKEISDRWRGFTDVADARNLDNRVEREVVDALVTAVRAAYPRLSHRYYALARKSCRTGIATRRCRKCRSAWSAGMRPRTRCSLPTVRSRRRWRLSPSGFSIGAGSMRRCGPARRRVRSRTRPYRRRILMCCSIIRANRAT
jgi:oligoendopeptidase F